MGNREVLAWGPLLMQQLCNSCRMGTVADSCICMQQLLHRDSYGYSSCLYEGSPGSEIRWLLIRAGWIYFTLALLCMSVSLLLHMLSFVIAVLMLMLFHMCANMRCPGGIGTVVGQDNSQLQWLTRYVLGALSSAGMLMPCRLPIANESSPDLSVVWHYKEISIVTMPGCTHTIVIAHRTH